MSDWRAARNIGAKQCKLWSLVSALTVFQVMGADVIPSVGAEDGARRAVSSSRPNKGHTPSFFTTPARQWRHSLRSVRRPHVSAPRPCRRRQPFSPLRGVIGLPPAVVSEIHGVTRLLVYVGSRGCNSVPGSTTLRQLRDVVTTAGIGEARSSERPCRPGPDVSQPPCRSWRYGPGQDYVVGGTESSDKWGHRLESSQLRYTGVGTR